MKNYDSLAEALTDLKSRGYEQDFETQPNCLYCGDLDIRLDPEDFKVDEVYRFEGESSPDENTILYAISSSSGAKGTIAETYGTYRENVSFEMAGRLQIDPEEKNKTTI